MSSASRTTAILSKRLRTSSRRSLSTTTSINSNASTWTRPLPEGSNPAYDASLAFLAQHSSSLLSKAERLRTKLSTVEDGELKSEIEIALKKAELEARIARPETRWLHENGNDVSSEGVEAGDREALNVLAERRWRKLGKLDRLVSLDTRSHGSRRSACFQTDVFPFLYAHIWMFQMERVISMSVVPDLVALPNPEIDLSVSYPSVSDPVPGDYLLPSQVSYRPTATSYPPAACSYAHR